MIRLCYGGDVILDLDDEASVKSIVRELRNAFSKDIALHKNLLRCR